MLTPEEQLLRSLCPEPPPQFPCSKCGEDIDGHEINVTHLGIAVRAYLHDARWSSNGDPQFIVRTEGNNRDLLRCGLSEVGPYLVH